jgi:hypothetical protein
VSTGVLVDAGHLATVVQALPGVAGLHGGRFGEISTFLPGRRVRGVRIRDDLVTIGVVARDAAAVPRLGDEVRAALGPLGRPVDVWVGDIAAPAASLRHTTREEKKS